ncbi:uncharacterized protein J4E78_009343 [Alternaria triticimaculans]|uniref:uncharacterized protein n=1 Tax=Alternaria triticimaculans TaxID=297637 RepID=UPI0020C3CF7F|nr:uncharacterized protein J4E78_009343 [Alternaria triticimaculans]KAI4645433.1 hypothetical protein J4E78_009343 [Alternaria triticimaculans]
MFTVLGASWDPKPAAEYLGRVVKSEALIALARDEPWQPWKSPGDGQFRFTKDIIRAEEIPPYAILSHTWGDEEVVFDDVKSSGVQDIATDKKGGWDKIRFCARQAKLHGLEHFWVDTCCIDKANNTELTEAINSMFRWYQNANKCYVYLPDVEGKSSMEEGRPSSAWKAAFRASRWFTRGWTLQELIAPRSVEFFSRDGTRLGDKESLEQTIHEVTKLPLEALSGREMSKFGFDERFSWAQDRQTTREEDGAYCLLGILGCSLPPIYGEGKEKAMKRLKKEVQGEERLIKIRSWLSAPDPSINYQKAHNQRQTGTGLWLLQHETFLKWKEGAASRLWLYGIPGCGKTILSSTVVEHLQHHCGDDKRKVTVYFYFDFNDAQKQIPELMLRSLLHQLLQHTTTVPDAVDALFSSCGDGQQQPPLHKLLTVAPEVMLQFTHVYIVLDALDECTERGELTKMLEKVAGWKLENTHLLMTSRKERDIETSLETFVVPDDMIGLQRDVVDADILQFVRQKLGDDKRLAKWNNNAEVRQEIETALMQGAQGMFRWAICQLDVIAECRNLAMLRKSLATLPKTLDQTYDRILTAISEDDRVYTIRILQWLTFSARPLSLREVAEVAAIDVAREPAFDHDEVLVDPLEALKICSSLVTIVVKESIFFEPGMRIVTLAHYSVQEYLISERIIQGPAKQYSMKEIECHKAMTIGCLWYLNRFQQPLTDEVYYASALAEYSAQSWSDHLQKTGDGEEEMSRLAMTLLLTNAPAFVNSIRIYNPETEEFYTFRSSEQRIGAPLYYASFLGLISITRLLLGQDVDVNAKGGLHGSALRAALGEGHLVVAELLVNAKADVDAEDEAGETALYDAIYNDDEAMAKFLIDAGADINKLVVGRYAIQDASEMGNEILVTMLIDAKANVSVRDEHGDDALTIALHGHHKAVVKLLIDASANVNTRDKDGRSALQIASSNGDEEVVRLLIKVGADVNAPGNEYSGHALLAAAEGGHTALVELLLDAGADVNAPGNKFSGHALLAAAEGGHTAMVELLLDAGADIDAQHAEWGSALHGAVRSSQETTAEVLLRRGASAASDMQSKGVMNHAIDDSECTPSLVRLLQQYSVPLDAIDAENMTPLHYFKVLLRMGANVPPGNEDLIDALNHAMGIGNPEILIGFLQSEQAKAATLITSKDKNGRNVLHRMFWAEWHEIETVQWLLDHGADGSELDNFGVSPLAQYLKSHSSTLDVEICRSLLDTREAASFVGHEGQTLGHFCAKRFDFRLAMLEVFDEGGVDLTKRDCRGRTVIHYAILYNTLTEQVLRYLVTAIGINPDEQDHQGRTALRYAVEKADSVCDRDSLDFKRLQKNISLLSELREREGPPLFAQPGSSTHLPNTSLPLNPNGNRMQ